MQQNMLIASIRKVFILTTLGQQSSNNFKHMIQWKIEILVRHILNVLNLSNCPYSISKSLYFPVNFTKFLRTLIFVEYLQWLRLSTTCYFTYSNVLKFSNSDSKAATRGSSVKKVVCGVLLPGNFRCSG